MAKNYTKIINSLPSSVPFVGPETQERLLDKQFDSRIGPEIYTGVYGSPSPDHNVLLLREYDMERKSMPKAIELLSKVEEIVQKEDSKMLALRPIIADKMDALFVVYYYSSIASMGEIIDRVGMSEEFQKLVNEASEYGTLTASNVLINI